MPLQSSLLSSLPHLPFIASSLLFVPLTLPYYLPSCYSSSSFLFPLVLPSLSSPLSSLLPFLSSIPPLFSSLPLFQVLQSGSIYGFEHIVLPGQKGFKNVLVSHYPHLKLSYIILDGYAMFSYLI